MFADLHLHTHFSDGTFSPEEVVSRGQRAGFAALALTDHDTVEDVQQLAERTGWRLELPALEPAR